MESFCSFTGRVKTKTKLAFQVGLFAVCFILIAHHGKQTPALALCFSYWKAVQLMLANLKLHRKMCFVHNSAISSPYLALNSDINIGLALIMKKTLRVAYT